MNQWEADCVHWYGRPLKGNFGHYCSEWDGLPIDETCMEFAACTCYPNNEAVKKIREKLWEQFDRSYRNERVF